MKPANQKIMVTNSTARTANLWAKRSKACSEMTKYATARMVQMPLNSMKLISEGDAYSRLTTAI